MAHKGQEGADIGKDPNYSSDPLASEHADVLLAANLPGGGLNFDDKSPAGTGRARGPDVSGGTMGWVQAGIILYAFAAPSAVMAVPYAVGMAGFVGGVLIAVVITTASVLGGMMLLEVKLRYPECHTFGDLGLQVLGRTGQIWGNIIQLGNFCLFMPCALQFCALALEGIAKGIPAFQGCSDYYVFLIALLCLLTTQVRTFSNTQMLSALSMLCVFAMGVAMIVAAFQYDSTPKVSAYAFGNPEPDTALSVVRFAGGFTINAWAYVPAFLTVELSTCMERPREFRKSLMLSGVLNIVVFVVVGVTVVARWGYDVGEVIGITFTVAAWQSGTAINTIFNTFQLIGNFISYMLDSVPLGRFCQKTWAPDFKDTWSAGDILRYLGYTMPAFLLALFLSIAVPSVNTLLDFTTALTTPWVTQIYPAVIYYKLRKNDAKMPEESQGREVLLRKPMDGVEQFAIICVYVIGCISFIFCSVKAVGYIAYAPLRPPLQIGCGSWLIWSSS
jgi:amino acid permease